MAYENNDYTSKGVGNAALTTGIIGTVLGSGILNNGLGGLFGGNQNPTASPIYQLAQKDTRIAQLESEKNSDAKFYQLSERMGNVEARVLAIEKTEPLRDQIIGERVANLQRVLDGVVRPFVPNYAVAPGWGPTFVSPFPPVPPVAAAGGTATPASTSNGTSQAA